MIDRKVLDKYYWFSWISDTVYEKLINESNWNLEESLWDINNLINDKIMRILSLCSDDEINIINSTNEFDDIIEIFEWIKWFSDNEYDILEERFLLSKKESEK